VDFASWLRNHNRKVQQDTRKIGFYGLDLYSLHTSAKVVIEYLNGVDREAAIRARDRYSCFDHCGEFDPESYGMSAAFGLSGSCEQGAIKMLMEMQKRESDLMARDGINAVDKEFYARINASVVRDAEEYYRGLFLRKNTWNLRDGHMVSTLDQLLQHVADIRKKESGASISQAEKDANGVKAVIWAHNSHLGDASYTAMAERGEKNVGQMVRQKYGKENTYNVGFSTYTGTVTAADEWDDPPQTMQVRPADTDTYEHLFHKVGKDFSIRFRVNKSCGESLDPSEIEAVKSLSFGDQLQERAIGVIYRPRTERASHLFRAKIANQFDSVIHIDRTTALQSVNDEYLSKVG